MINLERKEKNEELLFPSNERIVDFEVNCIHL